MKRRLFIGSLAHEMEQRFHYRFDYPCEKEKEVLILYYSVRQLGPTKTPSHEDVWCTYAAKQKRFILSLPGVIVSPPTNNFTYCYVCSNPVREDVHDPEPFGEAIIEHNWNISHLLPGSETNCHATFNLRIMCRQCNSDSGTQTPFEFASSRGYDETNSLAMKEHITSLERGVMVYFYRYHRERRQ